MGGQFQIYLSGHHESTSCTHARKMFGVKAPMGMVFVAIIGVAIDSLGLG